MKPVGLISAGVLLLLLGAVPPMYAQEDKHEQEAKPQKQEQAKPEKQQQQAKPAKQEQQQAKQQQGQQKQQQQAKSSKQEQQQQTKGQQGQQQKQQQANSTRQEHVQQVKGQQGQQREQAQGQWARNGQKDSRGHEYNESRFGRDHHARFEENGGRFYNGRREFSYGGYWFYAGAYPAWFYGQDVYFIMGADGLWYAVAYDNPSLTFQVDID